MRKLLIVSVLLCLTGCANTKQFVPYFKAQCSKEGWLANTPEHDSCVAVKQAQMPKRGGGGGVSMMLPGQPQAPRHCYTSGSGHTTCY